jgi:hypothetical protein
LHELQEAITRVKMLILGLIRSLKQL